MDLSELFSKLSDEDDISSEAELFDFQKAMYMLNKEKMSAGEIDKLFIHLAKAAKGQLEALMHYTKI